MARTKAFDENDKLEKAMQLFWEKGYAQTSMQDLVDRLSLHRGSIYDTYGSKDALFVRALRFYMQENTNRMADFLSQQHSVKKGFKKLFNDLLSTTLNDENNKGCFVVNTTTELLPHHPSIAGIVQNNQLRMVSIFTDFIERGKSNGELSTELNAEQLAHLLFTLYNGVMVVSKYDRNKKRLQASIDAVLNMLNG